jgi:hypothetical protein
LSFAASRAMVVTMISQITTVWMPEPGLVPAASTHAPYPMQLDRKDRIVLS